MNYYLSNNEGRFTVPIGKYTALRMLIQWGYMGMEFGETVFIEDEDGNLLYKKSWFEKRPTKVIDSINDDYFNGVVKRTLLELKDSVKKAKNDSETNFYKGRYEAQLKDFAEAMEMSEENLSLMIEK